MTMWFEDINDDDSMELGQYCFTQEEIIKYNKEYDNQYFHTDPELAKHSHFGGIIASGWHTACVGHRLMVDEIKSREEAMVAEGMIPGVSGPSPGIKKMTFMQAVRPEDCISYKLTVTSKRASASLPGWGLLFSTIIATNQKGEQVFQSDVASFSKMRDFKPTIKQRLGMWAVKIPLLKKLIGR